MSTPLTLHNAEITTATVEIKTLTVSGKQVTLAVFRQLQEAALVNDDGTLNGTPWGTVNYHPDKCADTAEHLHIVWQDGLDLRRARVDRVPASDQPGSQKTGFRHPALDRFLTAQVREWAHGRLTEPPLEKYTQASQIPGWEHFVLIDDVPPFVARASKAAIGVTDDGWSTGLAWEWWTSQEEALAALNEEVTGWGIPYHQILEDYEDVIQAEQQRRQRHRDTRAKLAELPQLFIAV
ncbi:hypothetical protein ACQP10_38400 (plasmid) [Streptosporangium sandarakinum]|uniref:hypothetical protein n=1 Tax=Streptosporangium sandarakinum TaxID=1260955 RepID=UPI003D8ABDC0